MSTRARTATAVIASIFIPAVVVAEENVGNWLSSGNAELAARSLRALIVMFVLATLIESALAVVFNWRLFLQLFNGRGMKTLVMIGVSALAVYTFNITTIETLVSSYQYGPDSVPCLQADPGGLAFWLTALVLAGGSAGVYNLLVAFGYRQPLPAGTVTPKPPKNKAWVSIKVSRSKAVGDIEIHVQNMKQVDANSPTALASIIHPAGLLNTIWYVFFRDQTRFPMSGGHEVAIDREYKLAVTGKDSNNKELSALDGKTYTFADGAIIDFFVTL